MLRWRIPLGILIVVALIGLCWLDHWSEKTLGMRPGVWLLPVAVGLVVLGGREVLQLASSAGIHPLPWTIHTGNILLVVSNWFPLRWGSWVVLSSGNSISPGNEPLLALAVGVLVVFLGEMYRFRKPGGAMVNVAVALFAIVYLGLMVSFAAQLRIQWGSWALVSLIVVVKVGDIGAYTVGRLFGRRKMAPTLSPGKTMEGAVGALAFACLASWLTFAVMIPMGRSEGAHATFQWGWLAFGLLVGCAGMVGDLAESMLKRDVGRKDSSDWLPGFGGVLDILDSVLLAAPIAWLFWAFELVGG